MSNKSISAKQPGASVSAATKRTRTVRNFPATTFEDALGLAKALLEFGAGQPVRRVSLFDSLGKSPDSGTSRQLITNAGKYGLTKGSYTAEQLELTPEGKKAADEQIQPRERMRARIQLAILDVEPFAALYNKFKELRLPAKAALTDAIKDADVPSEAAEEAVDTFIVNLRFVGLLHTLSGADRIITVDHCLDELPSSGENSQFAVASSNNDLMLSSDAHFETTAFYITPISPPDSEQRKHSDLLLGSIIEPALEPLKINVVRADKIDRPGVITKQVIEYLFRSRLVIADLSFHNPNVFYELAIRHMLRKPVVQIMRTLDTITFDVNQVRTIMIDTTDIYTLVPQIDTYRAVLATQVRKALENPESVDSPISVHFPGYQPPSN